MKNMTLREYFAATGSRFTDKDAAVIGPALEELHMVTATEIVSAARAESSPLHPYFEWRDSVAADLFRQEQARHMARSILVRVVVSPTRTEPVRAFHAVHLVRQPGEPPVAQEDSERSYVPVATLQEDPALGQQIVSEAHQQLIGWQRRYSQYRRLLPEFAERFGPLFKVLEGLDSADVE